MIVDCVILRLNAQRKTEATPHLILSRYLISASSPTTLKFVQLNPHLPISSYTFPGYTVGILVSKIDESLASSL